MRRYLGRKVTGIIVIFALLIWLLLSYMEIEKIMIKHWIILIQPLSIIQNSDKVGALHETYAGAGRTNREKEFSL